MNNPGKQVSRNKNPRNPSKRPNINERQARAIADNQIWQREFNADYDQVMLSISTGAVQALRCGSPPGFAG